MRARTLLLPTLLALAPCSTARAEPPAPPALAGADLDAIVGRIAESKAAEDAAIAELRRSGAAAVPALLRGLRHASESVRRACAGLLAEVAGTPPTPETLGSAFSLLRVQEPFVRLAAARIVLRGPDERVRVTALQALSAEFPGDDLAALLRPALADPSPLVRREAVAAVARLGPVVVALAPDVLRLLDTSGAEDRVRVVRAAAATRPPGEALAPLAERFARETREVRSATILALASADPLAERTAQVVREGLGDPEANVRGAALGAIDGGAPAGAETRAAVVRRLRDPDPSVAAAASKLVRGLRGTEGPWLADVLAALERDPTDATVRDVLPSWTATSGERYVALLPTAAPASTRELLKALSSSASEVVERLSPGLRETLPSVLARTDLDEESLQSALALYERIGDRTEEGRAAALIPLLAGPDGPVRRAVLQRLQSNGAARRSARVMLSGLDDRAREGALAWMAATPSLDAETQEAAATLLFDKDPAVVARAVRALLASAVPTWGGEASGPLLRFDSAEVFQGVRAALRDEDAATKWRAAAVLGGMGRTALPAVDDLRPLLLDPSRDVAVAAARAIDRIARAGGTSAREVLAGDLASEDTARVAAALLVLAEAGGYGLVVLPRLDEMLTVEDARTLIPALRAAARMRQEGRPLEARLLARRDHPDRVVVQAALDALAAIHSR